MAGKRKGGPPKRTDEECQEFVDQYFKHEENKQAAARTMGVARSTFQAGLDEAEDRGFLGSPSAPTSNVIEFPVFPDEDVSTERLIDFQCERFQKRKANHDAHTWFKVKVKDEKPIGILWFGDPHVDDNGANWPVLRRHCDLCKSTDGLYGANIGDTTNNWSGRLARLYANQDTSISTAQRYAAWFMLESGVRWLIWLIGNHDAWGDGAAVLSQMAKRHGTQQIICRDWEAKFMLAFPSGQEFKIWAAHNFAGTSVYNPAHGPLKASKFGPDAHLVICGDKHNWINTNYENPDRGLIQLIIRVRGYKFFDEHTLHLGKAEQQSGCSILTIFNPATGRIKEWEDIEEGVQYLTWLRKRH